MGNSYDLFSWLIMLSWIELEIFSKPCLRAEIQKQDLPNTKNDH
jgi:hypothetical protein